VTTTIWISAAAFALLAGITDLRWRRIPNWLTYPTLPTAIVLHAAVAGWNGTKLSLLGAGLGLGILLPFVIIRSLGGGDWKLAGCLGAFFGPERFLKVLLVTLIINGFMALIFVVWQRRMRQTLGNLARMGSAFLRLRLPGDDLSIDNPRAAKVPFGVAAAIAVLLCAAWNRSAGGF